MQSQLYHAERIGCSNFCNVFNNLDRAAFLIDTKAWTKLCFKVNGTIRSNYWAHWKINMDTKCPVPNIIEIKRSVDSMIIRTIGFKDTDKKSGYSVSLCNELLFNLGYVDEITSNYTDKTKQGLIDFINNLKTNNPEDLAIQSLGADGRCGRMTFRYLISEQPEGKEDYRFAFEVIMSPINIEGSGV